jgi:hypothetical protein
MSTICKTQPNRVQTRFVFFFLTVFVSFNCFAQPSISSFSPASGPVGTTVTITGTNFSATPSDNIVFIGGVKALVSAATTSSLSVTVPAGALFQPISITSNGLTCYSARPFIVTFNGGASVFTPQSFEYAARVDSVDSDIATTKHAIGDLDGDNRLDVVTIDRLNNTMSVYRNTTANGNISFAPKVDFSAGQSPRSVAVADIDGDGKPDVVVTNLKDNTVSIFRNTGSGGVISFAAKVDQATAVQPAAISVTDIDKDGKPDLVINTVNLEGYISVLRNTGTAGAISFAPHIDIQSLGGSIEEIRTADVDGDGMPDIVLPDYATSSIKIFRNTSSLGAVSFAAAKSVSTLSWPTLMETGDLNDDGKPDLVVANFAGSKVQVLKNISTSGNIVFQAGNTYSAGSIYQFAMNDLDGDGKPDLALNVYGVVYLYKNISNPNGDISFNAPVTGDGTYTSSSICGDFDNDGKVDISLEAGIFRTAIWKNRTTSPQLTSFSPMSARAGDVVTIKGANFTKVTSVSFGKVPAASFTVLSETEMTAVVGAGASGDVSISNTTDSTGLPGFIYQGPPVIFSFTPTSAASYEKVTIKGQNFRNASAVKIGNTSYPYTVIDPYTIELTIIGIGNSGDISVTNSYGTGTLAGFTYVPKPYINSVSPAKVTKGTVVTINGYNFKDVTAVSFGGIPAASITIKDAYSLTAVVGDGASGSVQVTSAYGTAEKTGIVFYPAPVITSFSPVEAAQGDTVTITGLNFLHTYSYSAITSVSIGNVNASFTIIDSFTIKAKVGSGASGAVMVASDRGNTSLPGFTFIYPPNVTAVSPKLIGPGTEVTINGSNLARTTAVLFGGIAARSFTIVSDNTIKAVVGVGAGGYMTINTPKHSVNSFWFEFTATPLIYNIAPTAGPVGTTVTITGTNFQPGVSDNIVYFGGVKAPVLSATANTITVAVPAGAGYKPISIASPVTRLTARSYQLFNVTFPVDPAAFNDNSFAGRMDFATGVEPQFVKHADLDGDGKLDMVIVHQKSTFFSVYRNLSVPGRLSFSPRLDIEMGASASALTIADIDVDGKQDVLISETTSSGTSKTHIFHNQSTMGTISLKDVYSIYLGAGFLETADINLDGRLDLIGQCRMCGGAGFYFALNKSSNGNLSFEEAVNYRYYGDERGINSGLVVTDYNRDGKPDLVVGVTRSSSIFYFTNDVTGSLGYHFDIKKSDPYYWAGWPTVTPFTGSFTSQEYPDLVAGYFVLKNNSGTYVDALNNFRTIMATSVYDLNGDGKQEIIGENADNDKFAIMKNTGNYSIAFADPYSLNMPGGVTEVADLDGDSKPEICVLNQNSGILTILRNRIGEALPPPPIITAFSPSTQIYSNQVVIKGSNFDQTTSVTFGSVPALYFTVISSDSIIATVGKGASGAVRVTTPGGTDSLAGFNYIPFPEIMDFTPKGAVKGSAITITGVNFTGATVVSFGGTASASFIVRSADTIIAYVGNGATGIVSVEGPGGAGTKDGFLYYQQPVISGISPTSATTNAQIVIWGDHFEGVSLVSLGGVPATSFFVYPDFKSIVATVGAGASGNVTVVNPAGSASLPGFTFISPYVPSITSFAPTAASSGTTVTIKGKYFTTATAVSLGGVKAASFTVVDSATINAVIGTGASGSVTVTTTFGTATSAGFTYKNVTAIVDPADVNSKELTVSPNPAHDLLIIKHPASAKNARMRFFNILGREVKVITPAINATQSETSVLGLAPGVYNIVWSEGVRTLSRVFVIQ